MTENDFFSSRTLTIEDLIQVATIHKFAFIDSALSKLGIEPIRRYYEWQITGPHKCFATGVFKQNILQGYCFAGVFKGSLSGFIKRNKRFLLKWVIFRPWLLLNPLVFKRIQTMIDFLPKSKNESKTIDTDSLQMYGILSIAVQPESQGKGIGHLLMQQVESDAIKKHFTKIFLTVHSSNTQALRFYQGVGWNKQIDSTGNWNGLLVKEIS